VPGGLQGLLDASILLVAWNGDITFAVLAFACGAVWLFGGRRGSEALVRRWSDLTDAGRGRATVPIRGEKVLFAHPIVGSAMVAVGLISLAKGLF
jgi:hypothetical protein